VLFGVLVFFSVLHIVYFKSYYVILCMQFQCNITLRKTNCCAKLSHHRCCGIACICFESANHEAVCGRINDILWYTTLNKSGCMFLANESVIKVNVLNDFYVLVFVK
jgi:hypothetical protein